MSTNQTVCPPKLWNSPSWNPKTILTMKVQASAVLMKGMSVIASQCSLKKKDTVLLCQRNFCVTVVSELVASVRSHQRAWCRRRDTTWPYGVTKGVKKRQRFDNRLTVQWPGPQWLCSRGCSVPSFCISSLVSLYSATICLPVTANYISRNKLYRALSLLYRPHQFH